MKFKNGLFLWFIFLCFSTGSVYAGNNENMETRTIEFTLPVKPVNNKPVVEKNREALAFKKVEDYKQVNLVKRKTFSMSPELVKMGKQVNALLKQPVSMKSVIAYQSQQLPFMAYVEHELLTSENIQRHVELIELTAVLIGSAATPKLLYWGEKFRNKPYRLRAIIHALSNWPSSKESEAFVNSVLGEEVQAPNVIQAALLYQAWNKTPSARLYVGQYMTPKTGTNYQFLSMYLAAVLGNKKDMPFLLEALNKKPPAYQQYYLLLALSHLLSNADYAQIIQNPNIDADIKKSVQRQYEFVRIEDGQRRELLDLMLNSTYKEERMLAIDYIIKQKNYLKLSELISGKGLLGVKIYHQALYSGLSIEMLGYSKQIIHLNDAAAPIKENNNGLLALVLTIMALVMLWVAGVLSKHFKKSDVVV